MIKGEEIKCLLSRFLVKSFWISSPWFFGGLIFDFLVLGICGFKFAPALRQAEKVFAFFSMSHAYSTARRSLRHCTSYLFRCDRNVERSMPRRSGWREGYSGWRFCHRPSWGPSGGSSVFYLYVAWDLFIVFQAALQFNQVWVRRFYEGFEVEHEIQFCWSHNFLVSVSHSFILYTAVYLDIVNSNFFNWHVAVFLYGNSWVSPGSCVVTGSSGEDETVDSVSAAGFVVMMSGFVSVVGLASGGPADRLAANIERDWLLFVLQKRVPVCVCVSSMPTVFSVFALYDCLNKRPVRLFIVASCAMALITNSSS